MKRAVVAPNLSRKMNFGGFHALNRFVEKYIPGKTGISNVKQILACAEMKFIRVAQTEINSTYGKQ